MFFFIRAILYCEITQHHPTLAHNDDDDALWFMADMLALNLDCVTAVVH